MSETRSEAVPNDEHGDGDATSSPPAMPRCYRHPMRETGVRCVRCDRPICPECMRPASVGFQCPDDVKLGQVRQRTPRTVVGASTGTQYPYVTWTLVGLNVLAYIATAAGSVRGWNQNHTSHLFQSWVLVPYKVGHDGQYGRLLTAAFLHYGLLHIFFNMMALLMIGPFLERLLGTWRFASVYLIAALGSSVTVYAFDSRYVAVAGASGAIYGLFAAALLLVRELQLNPQWLVGTIVLNFVFTFGVPGVSKLGHIGGFVIGGLATVAIAGVPWDRHRMSTRIQAAGLTGVLVVLIIGIVWRTAVIS
ncbi:MAG TPA: rhomboid family intramembrane serine protease [Jatrophihabitantaceae bacterium]|nr:rhomboid family intramembrane serine protease [Jatrophihabitantaceae bacterium]